MKKRVFENKQNGYRMEVGRSWVWWFLAGPFYMLFHGAWKYFLMTLILAPALFLIPYFFIFPFYAKKMLVNSYLERGWEEVETP